MPLRSGARGGLLLLEVMVALVVLSLIGLGALQLAHVSRGVVSNAREWSDAVTYAEDGMELAKLGSSAIHGPPGDLLPGGLRRQITRRPISGALGFEDVTVTILFPDGGHFDLHRLAHVTADGGEEW